MAGRQRFSMTCTIRGSLAPTPQTGLLARHDNSAFSPSDRRVSDRGAEAHVAHLLNNSEGRSVELIAALYRQPLR
jgi:hypothetical protein